MGKLPFSSVGLFEKYLLNKTNSPRPPLKSRVVGPFSSPSHLHKERGQELAATVAAIEEIFRS
jgi:hypothetical protein